MAAKKRRLFKPQRQTEHSRKCMCVCVCMCVGKGGWVGGGGGVRRSSESSYQVACFEARLVTGDPDRELDIVYVSEPSSRKAD